MKWITPGILALVLVVLAIGMTVGRAPRIVGEMDLAAFGKITVVDRGRAKPLDTLARTTLLLCSDRSSFKDAQGQRHPAIRFLADAMTASLSDPDTTAVSDTHPVFRIENEQLLVVLGLPERDGFRYSVDEMRPKFPALAQQVELARQVDSKRHTRFQKAVMELAGKLNLYTSLVQWQVPLSVPPSEAGGEWRSLFDAAHAGQLVDHADVGVKSFAAILNSYAANDVAAFNQAVAQHRSLVASIDVGSTRRASVEYLFNRADLFGQSSALYVLIFIVGCVSWLFARQTLGRAAVIMLIATLLIHTAALIIRIYLQGRPPVTNLYSSAIFIGWGCVVFGLIIELFQRNAIGTVIAAVIGFVTLRIAHFLSLDGDTLEMMRAVLDTNFWLATHVITITLGYSATFIAGLLGVIFILRGMFTPTLGEKSERSLGLMIYGTACFALLLSFVGTVLGGIWADQSWGRFWGWDTKENGALILVLWNALILHARWDRLIAARGIAVLAIVGNIVTAWSWFGVNLLGVGLHSYGFLEGGWFWLYLFVGINLSLILMGILPRKYWWSYDVRAVQADESPIPSSPKGEG